MELVQIMEALASERSVFHSEADFQFALAGQIQRLMPEARVRLEFRPYETERKYLDMWVRLPHEDVALELKYVTRKLAVRVEDEPYDLLNQSAQDIRRYDFLKDVMRLERLAEERPETKGYALFLTNDASFWKRYDRTDRTDEAFRIHQGRSVTGTLTWSAHAGAGTKKGREVPVVLRHEYQLEWREYSRPSPKANGQLRYCMVSVGG